MMLAVREADEEWVRDALNVKRENEALEKRLEASGFSKEEREGAADWLGLRLIADQNGVLISFLKHTMATDGALLSGMPAAPEEGADLGQGAQGGSGRGFGCEAGTDRAAAQGAFGAYDVCRKGFGIFGGGLSGRTRRKNR